MKLGLLVLGFAVLLAQTGHGQGAPPAGPLTFFKNYFVTGDYKVAGIGLQGQGVNGIATGTIRMSGVPDDADILAAFLYWQVVTSDGPDSGSLTASFNGQLLSAPGPPDLPTPGGPIAVVGSPFGTSPCWSNGGATGSSGGSKKTFTYRADVLRFLAVDDHEFLADGVTKNPHYGTFIVNGPHEMKLPDSGNSNSTPRALGASLVVIYRDPKPATDLSAIVIYDGSYTMDNTTGGMAQTMKGFYDPYPAAGQITHIVGSGQFNKPENLIVPGITTPISNPFRSGDGASWDTVTRATGTITGDSATTTVTHDSGNFDCLTWSAVIYRTRVKDTDNDGLLDKWESSTSTLYDPNGEALPNLNAMGASPSRRDLFVEIASMKTDAPLHYGPVSDSSNVKPAHDHLPTYEALKKVGRAFLDQGITLHVDVGGNYQSQPAGCYELPCLSSLDPVHIIRPAAGARGGEWMNETITNHDAAGNLCVPDATDGPWVCQFAQYPGTVGWKVGYRFIRDMPLSVGGVSNPTEAACEAAERDGAPGTCNRVFDSNRRDMFHFVLFAHAIGIPKDPCFGADGFPDFGCMEGAGADHPANPLFHVPATNTGVGDILGADAMITLGGFNSAAGLPVGTDYMQGATLAHELGHTLGLLHGAVESGPDRLVVPEPGCKPNYLSVMNYLFQLRGLLDDSGIPHVDFSGQTLSPLTETSLTERGLLEPGTLASPRYRTGWYAPKQFVARGTAATKHCDGSGLKPSEELDLHREDGVGGMVRVDSQTVAATTAPLLDWDFAGAVPSQDINFDGEPSAVPLNGFNDWSNLRLNQVGSRRNVGGWYWVRNPDPAGTPLYFAFMGAISDGVMAGDLSASDLGKGGLGKGGLGKGGLGLGDLNMGDLGAPDGLGKGGLGKGGLGKGGLGKGGLGKGGLGKGGLGKGGLGEGIESRTDTFAGSGFSPVTELKAFVRGTNGAGGSNSSMPAGVTWQPETTNCATLTPVNCHRIRVDWSLSTAGPAQGGYRIFREIAGIGSEITSFGYTENAGQFTLFDTDELPSGPVTYSVIAVFTFEGKTVESNESFATLTAVNVAPTAAADPTGGGTYPTPSGVALVVDAPGVLANDTDVDSPSLTAVKISGPGHGTVTLNANGSFTYTPAAGYSGADDFTYRATDADTTHTSDATVSIMVRDSTPPLVTITVIPATPNGLASYYITTPTVTVTATDPSNVTALSCTDGVGGPAIAFGATTSPTFGGTSASGSFSLTKQGTTNVVCNATDAAIPANSGRAPTSTPMPVSVKIDTVKPDATISTPAEGFETTASSISISFTGSDPSPSSGGPTLECKLDSGSYAACTSPKNLTGLTVGAHTFFVRATDTAGNVDATPATRTFKVIYTFTASALKSPATLGSAVPISWQLKNPDGTAVSSLSTLLKMESVFKAGPPTGGSCVASAVGTKTTPLYLPGTGATGGSDFRLVSGGYQFNWDSTTAKTPDQGKGCYTVLIYLSDLSAPKMTSAVQLR